jgi:hypothetical protein
VPAHAPIRRTFAALVALAFALGCPSDSERRHRAEVALLAEHIDRLRSADNANKREPLSRLMALECRESELCALKDLCVRAYDLHQNALDSIEHMKQVDPKARSPVELAQTERDLQQARQLGEQCAEEQVRVVRKVLL